MRILIKGGVWKNTEDEILKAAVMKYGKNQWARVASLMNRKSAKQCKARWYEWLDPSIKKTEWSRDEEEKLLHLAKLMPNQWRTIAPIVGRTAGQCMEHYEQLLDQAQAEGSAEVTDDPRRLRPGEIDPTPENKPARPDPIDMDEDEKEMLSEARARLANTKGKKAKRKARERMLEDSRRLSLLQKRRELKAAGIESKLSSGNKKRKFIDYAREIPFQKQVPVGFYDVTEEDAEGKKMHLDPKKHGMELAKMDGKQEKEEEERNKQRDKKIMKNLFKENAPLAVMKIAAEADPVSLRKRVALELPAPQVSEAELEDIVRLGKATLMAAPESGGITATQALIGDYSQVFRPSNTPLRTPQQEDIIMQEARNLRALREMTPLTTTELPELYEGTGFSGVTPRRANLTTPNVLLNMSAPSGNVPGTPAMSLAGTVSNRSVAGSKFAPPTIRDQFGLNSADISDNFSVSDVSSFVSKADRERSKQAKLQLLSQLQQLPEPEYTYEVALPQVKDDEEEEFAMLGKPEDAAETQARQVRQEEERIRAELERRSSVLKRELPRPVLVSLDGLSNSSLDPAKYPADVVSASKSISQEVLRILIHEETLYPTDAVKSKALTAASNIKLEAIHPEKLSLAAALIEEELRKASNLEEEESKLVEAITKLQASMVYVPGSQEGTGSLKVPSNKKEHLSALMSQFMTLANKFEKDRKRVGKVESKLQVLTQGYQNRAVSLAKSIQLSQAEFSQATSDLDGVTLVKEKEIVAARTRLDRALEEAIAAEALEAQSQSRYSQLVAYAKLNEINIV